MINYFNKEKFFGFIALIFCKILDSTCRYVYVNPELKYKAENLTDKNNYIQAHWHQVFLPVLMGCQFNNSSTIVSPSRDGDIISIVCRGFTMKVCRGSSSRGGANALRQMIRLLKSGRSTTITVDGPKGPIYKVKRGVFEMSKTTGVPILPTSNYPSKFYEFKKSWDNYRLPLPFSTIYVKYGEPFIVNPKMSKDELINYSNKLEKTLLQIDQELKSDFATT